MTKQALAIALLLIGWAAVVVPAPGIHAQPLPDDPRPRPLDPGALPGDLNGDGGIDAADEVWLAGFYGTTRADPGFEPGADLDGDGRVDHRDLALLGAAYGKTGARADTSPPDLRVTLNHIPDDQNDLLVVPPAGFQITLAFHSDGGSVLDTRSLSVTSDQPMGGRAAGSELAGLFQVTPTGALFEVPVGNELRRTLHTLTVSVADVAGNAARQVYVFAVHDFPFGPPLGRLQVLFLDFGQDRSLEREIDFVEDLRHFGLGSRSAPAIEATMRERLADEIVSRAHAFYGRGPDGSPGPDAANVFFVSSRPGGTHSRLCVGGESSLGDRLLGASTMDAQNLWEDQDECGAEGWFGVFPRSLDRIWGTTPEFQATFHPLMPSWGGIPVGEDPLDATVTADGFDPGSASAAELTRWLLIENAVDAFAAAIGAVAAHETGHLLGLVSHGPTPWGLYGGNSGANADHGVTARGETPSQNHLMNAGGSFSFDALTGRNGFTPPAFRALSWAYLRDRLVVLPEEQERR